MIGYAPFNTKQVEYFKRTLQCWLNVAEGGKRAGKNILNILAFAENLETHPDKIHLAAGVTKATAKMNILDSNGFGLEHYFKGRCRTGTYNGVDCLYITTRRGNKVVLYAGGKDSDDYRSIKGFSLGSVYVTEANECHQTFIQECMDRTLASRDRKIFFDINPKPPRHWFYTDLLDFQDKLKEQGENPRYNLPKTGNDRPYKLSQCPFFYQNPQCYSKAVHRPHIPLADGEIQNQPTVKGHYYKNQITKVGVLLSGRPQPAVEKS